MTSESLSRRRLFQESAKAIAKVVLGGAALETSLAACDDTDRQQNPEEFATQQAIGKQELAEKQQVANEQIKQGAETIAAIIDRRMQADRSAGKKVVTPINEVGTALLIAEAPTHFKEAPMGAYTFRITGGYDQHGKLIPGTVQRVIINEDLTIEDQQYDKTSVPYFAISYETSSSSNWQTSEERLLGPNSPLTNTQDAAYPDVVDLTQIRTFNTDGLNIVEGALSDPIAPLYLPPPIVASTGK